LLCCCSGRDEKQIHNNDREIKTISRRVVAVLHAPMFRKVYLPTYLPIQRICYTQTYFLNGIDTTRSLARDEPKSTTVYIIYVHINCDVDKKNSIFSLKIFKKNLLIFNILQFCVKLRFLVWLNCTIFFKIPIQPPNISCIYSSRHSILFCSTPLFYLRPTGSAGKEQIYTFIRYVHILWIWFFDFFCLRRRLSTTSPACSRHRTRA